MLHKAKFEHLGNKIFERFSFAVAQYTYGIGLFGLAYLGYYLLWWGVHVYVF